MLPACYQRAACFIHRFLCTTACTTSLCTTACTTSLLPALFIADCSYLILAISGDSLSNTDEYNTGETVGNAISFSGVMQAIPTIMFAFTCQVRANSDRLRALSHYTRLSVCMHMFSLCRYDHLSSSNPLSLFIRLSLYTPLSLAALLLKGSQVNVFCIYQELSDQTPETMIKVMQHTLCTAALKRMGLWGRLEIVRVSCVCSCTA